MDPTGCWCGPTARSRPSSPTSCTERRSGRGGLQAHAHGLGQRVHSAHGAHHHDQLDHLTVLAADDVDALELAVCHPGLEEQDLTVAFGDLGDVAEVLEDFEHGPQE